jgi:hypothetical protein
MLCVRAPCSYLYHCSGGVLSNAALDVIRQSLPGLFVPTSDLWASLCAHVDLSSPTVPLVLDVQSARLDSEVKLATGVPIAVLAGPSELPSHQGSVEYFVLVRPGGSSLPAPQPFTLRTTLFHQTLPGSVVPLSGLPGSENVAWMVTEAAAVYLGVEMLVNKGSLVVKYGVVCVPPPRNADLSISPAFVTSVFLALGDVAWVQGEEALNAGNARQLQVDATPPSSDKCMQAARGDRAVVPVLVVVMSVLPSDALQSGPAGGSDRDVAIWSLRVYDVVSLKQQAGSGSSPHHRAMTGSLDFFLAPVPTPSNDATVQSSSTTSGVDVCIVVSGTRLRSKLALDCRPIATGQDSSRLGDTLRPSAAPGAPPRMPVTGTETHPGMGPSLGMRVGGRTQGLMAARSFLYYLGDRSITGAVHVVDRSLSSPYYLRVSGPMEFGADACALSIYHESAAVYSVSVTSVPAGRSLTLGGTLVAGFLPPDDALVRAGGATLSIYLVCDEFEPAVGFSWAMQASLLAYIAQLSPRSALGAALGTLAGSRSGKACKPTKGFRGCVRLVTPTSLQLSVPALRDYRVNTADQLNVGVPGWKREGLGKDTAGA